MRCLPAILTERRVPRRRETAEAATFLFNLDRHGWAAMEGTWPATGGAVAAAFGRGHVASEGRRGGDVRTWPMRRSGRDVRT
jgi:hypothetical protein